MMKEVMGQQNSCKTLIGMHEMHTYNIIYIYNDNDVVVC